MTKFKFDNQISAELYRKWFLLGKKDPENLYDKEQIDDLYQAINYQIGSGLEELIKLESEIIRSQIPFLHIYHKKFRKFDVEILVMKNTIECKNIPGCMAEGNNRRVAFENLLKAIIVCSDIRIKRKYRLLNKVYPLDIFKHVFTNGVNSIHSNELINFLKSWGWNIEIVRPYFSVLLKEDNRVAFTIPNNSEISESLHLAYNLLIFTSHKLHKNY